MHFFALVLRSFPPTAHKAPHNAVLTFQDFLQEQIFTRKLEGFSFCFFVVVVVQKSH
jgi:hypothetical protein